MTWNHNKLEIDPSPSFPTDLEGRSPVWTLCNQGNNGLKHPFFSTGRLLLSLSNPRCLIWTLDSEPALPRGFPFKSREFRFPEPAIPFPNWSAISHPKPRDVTSGSGDFRLSPSSLWFAVFTSLATTLATPTTNQKPPSGPYEPTLLLLRTGQKYPLLKIPRNHIICCTSVKMRVVTSLGTRKK